MPRLGRVTQQIFASTPGFQQVTQFGSTFAGSTNFTTNIATIQALSNWLGGFYDAAIAQSNPLIEDMNGVFLVLTQQLAYLLQEGIAEWDSGTTYYTGNLIQTGGIVYRSLIDSNLNNDPTTAAGTSWGSMLQPGVETINSMVQNTTVTTGNTLTWPNMVVPVGSTFTVNNGASFIGMSNVTVNGTMIINGTCRII